jgi:excisionase family DNA binding protein
MSEEKMLTVRDAAIMLGISEKDVLTLSEQGILPSHKIGEGYLRFKKEQIVEFSKSAHHSVANNAPSIHDTPREKFFDFLYLNDFYIVAILIILALLVVIFRGY